MRRGRSVLVALAVVSGLLIGCVWLVPGLLDWNRYRDGIAALAAQRLGRPVRIGGAITLQLLPQPVLTAADIAIDDAGDGILLQARALRLRVAFGPLLAGTIDARELTLQGAELRLPWPPQAGALSRPPAWITGLHATVEDSRLQIGDLALTDIDATLVTDPETGTLSAAGIGQSGARVWQFTARLAQPSRDGAAGLDISLDGQGPLRDTGGTFSGQIAADGALTGRVAGRGPDLSQLMPAPAMSWRGDGRLSARGGLAVADELALEIGGAPARGAVALRVLPTARLDLSISAGRLDLDAWLPALLARDPAGLRAGLPTGIDLSAEAATLAGGTLRHLRGAADLGSGTILVRDVAALLPGEAQLSLSGQVGGDLQPRFDGSVRLTAPDLRTTLRWLQPVLPQQSAGLPPDVLRTAAVSAHVVADANQAALTDLRGTIDGGRVTGTAAIRLPGSARPVTPAQGAVQGAPGRLSITAAVALERLAVDAWLPDPTEYLAPEPAMAALGRLRSADLDLRVQVARGDWGPIPLGTVAVELQSEASRVVLRRLEAQPLGMRLTASGQVGDGGRVTDGKLDFSAADLSALQFLLPDLPAAWAGARSLLRGPGSLVVQAGGQPESISGRVTLELSDLRAEAQPVVNLSARSWAGPLMLHHPGAPRLLELLGLGGTASWLGDGSMSLVGQMAAAPGRLEMESGTLAAGAFRATGRMAVERGRIVGQIMAESLPLPAVYARSPEPIAVAWLRGTDAAIRVEAAQVLVGLTPVAQDASADLTLEGGVLRLARIAAKQAGGTASGAMMLDSTAVPPRLALQANVAGMGITTGLFETPVELVAGNVDVILDLTAAGNSPAALLATLGGRATIRVREGVASGFDLPQAGAALSGPARDATDTVRSALLAGTTGFSLIDAPLTLSRGVVSITARLASPAGAALLSGSLDLPGNAADLKLLLEPAMEGGPAVGLRLTGPSNELKRTPELAGLARWLADRPISDP